MAQKESELTSQGELAPNPNSRGDKEQLEVEKLRAEIRNLTRSHWSTPSVVVPLFATIVTLAITWSLGVFDARRQMLQVERERLEARTGDLREEVNKLTSLRNQLSANTKDLEQRLTDLNGKVAAAEAARLKAQKDLADTKTRLAKPLLEINVVIDPQNKIALELHNSGNGIAQVKDHRVFVDGRRIAPGAPPNQGQPIMEALEFDSRFGWFLVGGSVRPNETMKLFWVDLPDANASTVSRFRAGMSRVEIEMCYCSLLKECDWVTYRRSPPREKCE